MTWQRKVQVYKRDMDAKLHPGDGSAGRGGLLAVAARVRREGRLQGPGPPVEPRQLLRGLRARDADRAQPRSHDHRRAHPPDGAARQHQPGPLQPVHDRPRPEAVRGRQADHLRGHPLRAVSGTVLAGPGRQLRSATSPTPPGATRRRCSARETRSSPPPRSSACATSRSARTSASWSAGCWATSSSAPRTTTQGRGRARGLEEDADLRARSAR